MVLSPLREHLNFTFTEMEKHISIPITKLALRMGDLYLSNPCGENLKLMYI